MMYFTKSGNQVKLLGKCATIRTVLALGLMILAVLVLTSVFIVGFNYKDSNMALPTILGIILFLFTLFKDENPKIPQKESELV